MTASPVSSESDGTFEEILKLTEHTVHPHLHEMYVTHSMKSAVFMEKQHVNSAHNSILSRTGNVALKNMMHDKSAFYQLFIVYII